MQEVPVLRPLGVGEIIDRTLRLIRANLVLFLSIAVVPALLEQIMQRASGITQTLDPNNFSGLFDPRTAATARPPFVPPDPGALIVAVIAGSFLSLLTYGAITAVAAERYLGRPIAVRAAFERGLRAVPAMFVSLLLLITVLSATFVLFFVVVALINSAALSVIAVIIGLIALFFILFWVLVSLAVLGPVIVVERLGPIAAIRRSFHLVDKARWRTLGLYLLVGIIAGILGTLFSLVFLVSFVTEPTARTVLQTVASVASAAVTGPLTYGAFVILYYDLRVRREAFDPQLPAEALPGNA